MTLGELILDLASIDNTQNIPQREMMDWDVCISDEEVSSFEVLSFYCDESKRKIYIDIERVV